MVNFDGRLIDGESNYLNHQNRAFKYGDAILERIRMVSGKLVFWEDHYFRMVASMRILRMKIPMEFTMEFFEQEIHKLNSTDGANADFEVHIFVFRNELTQQIPSGNSVKFLIELKPLTNPFYQIGSDSFEVELFKDYYIAPGLLSSLGSSNNLLLTVADVYRAENDYDACFLLNSNKSVVGATNGNIFVLKDTEVKTAPILDGAKNTVIRKMILGVFENWDEFVLKEESISPFELQKADEIFIVDDISGIIPVSKYRKKTFAKEIAQKLLGRINTLARLS